MPRCSLEKSLLTGIALAAVLSVPWSATASAEESGHWKGKAVLVITSAPTVKVADTADHTVSLTQFDGVVFSEGEKPFLDNARYQAVDLFDSGGMVSGGYKTFTDGNGAKVFGKYTVTGGAQPTFNGEWTFIGGTDRYKGITGNGTFVITFTSDTTAWDMLEGEYRIP
jgi:hypothetical protein